MNAPAPMDLSKPMTEVEHERFDYLDGVIRDNLVGFMRVGTALAEIKAKGLFRGRYATFEAYVKKVHDMGRSRAYQLMDAAQVVESVHSCGQTAWQPQNEAQARPLVKVMRSNPELLPQVVAHAMESARDGRITAGTIERCAKYVLGEKVETGIRQVRSAAAMDKRLSADLKEAFDLFVSEVNRERSNGYRTSSREAIVKLIDSLRTVLDDEGSLRAESAFSGSAADANKLEQAGFQLFRMDPTSKSIKIRAGGGWPKHSGPYETLVAMETAFAELVNDPKHIRG